MVNLTGEQQKKLENFAEQLFEIFEKMFIPKEQAIKKEVVFVMKDLKQGEIRFYGQQAKKLISFVERAEKNLFIEITATGHSKEEIISDFFAQLDEKFEGHEKGSLFKNILVELAEPDILFFQDGRLTVAYDPKNNEIGYSFQGKYDVYSELTGKYVALLRLLKLPIPDWV